MGKMWLIVFAIVAASLPARAGEFMGAIVVDRMILRPPLELSGVGEDTLRVNGVPIEPARGGSGIRYPELTSDERYRAEAHYTIGRRVYQIEDLDKKVELAESLYVATGSVAYVTYSFTGGLVVQWNDIADPDTIPTTQLYGPKLPPIREYHQRRKVEMIERAMELRRLVVICPNGLGSFQPYWAPTLCRAAEIVLDGREIPEGMLDGCAVTAEEFRRFVLCTGIHGQQATEQ